MQFVLLFLQLYTHTFIHPYNDDFYVSIILTHKLCMIKHISLLQVNKITFVLYLK
jgi:hypothetical protein